MFLVLLVSDFILLQQFASICLGLSLPFCVLGGVEGGVSQAVCVDSCRRGC